MLLGPGGQRKTKKQIFEPPIFARYVKIIPKQWKKNAYPCTKLDIIGCPKNEGKNLFKT